jgi:hypothetical protein
MREQPGRWAARSQIQIGGEGKVATMGARHRGDRRRRDRDLGCAESVVEILLLADAGDVTGAGSERFITTCRWGNSVARASRCSR